MAKCPKCNKEVAYYQSPNPFAFKFKIAPLACLYCGVKPLKITSRSWAGLLIVDLFIVLIAASGVFIVRNFFTSAAKVIELTISVCVFLFLVTEWNLWWRKFAKLELKNKEP